MPKNEYYQFIKKYKIQDFLSLIDELSFTKKLEILQELKENYSVKEINKSLYRYKTEYIDLDRAYIFRVKNTLKGMCKRIQEGE